MFDWWIDCFAEDLIKSVTVGKQTVIQHRRLFRTLNGECNASLPNDTLSSEYKSNCKSYLPQYWLLCLFTIFIFSFCRIWLLIHGFHTAGKVGKILQNPGIFFYGLESCGLLYRKKTVSLCRDMDM